jgi:hypothetical protein
VLHVVDVGRCKVGRHVATSTCADLICPRAALTAIRGQLGVLLRLQADNEQGLAGSANEPGAVARQYLPHGASKLSIPFAEPR